MRLSSNQRKLSGLRCWISAPLALAVLTLVHQAPVQAGQVTFAQFSQAGTGSPFVFTNQATNATAGIVNLSTQVNFNFTVGGVSNASHQATLTLHAVTDEAATSATLGGKTYVSQGLNGNNGSNPAIPQNTVVITDNTTHQVLLSMTFTGDITGQKNSSSGSITGNSDASLTTHSYVTYSSQVLSGLNNSTPNSYVLGLTSIAPGGLSVGSGNFLNSFTSALTGSFSRTTTLTVVPEPASIAMFGTGILGTVVLATQRKRLALLRQS